MFQLYDWQVPLAEELMTKWRNSKTGCAISALPTGAGKTYITAAVLHRANVLRVLVVSPKNVLTMWRQVLKSAQVPCFDVVNWDQIRNGNRSYGDSYSWRLPKDTAVVVDECHRGASGPDAIATHMLARLRAYNIPVICQSATVADSPLKLRGVGFLVGLHGFSAHDYYSWCKTLGCRMDMLHRRWVFARGAAGRRHMQQLHQQLKNVMVHIPIEDIPRFPECQYRAELYDLDERYAGQVKKIYDELDERLKRRHSNPLVEMLWARERVEHFKVPLLQELVEDLVDEGRSAVVFFNFRAPLHDFETWCKSKWPTSVIHGDQSAEDRQVEQDRFQNNDSPVCLATTGAGGIALSLHDVKHERPRSSLLLPGFNASETRQALGRIRRAGGTPVVQTFVLAANTIEERIWTALQGKFKNIDTLNDGDLQ